MGTSWDRDLEKDSDQDIDDLIDVQMKSKNGPDVAKEDVRPEVGNDHDNHSLSVDDSNRESILDVPWETGWDEVLPDGRKDEIAKFFIQKFDPVDWDVAFPNGWKEDLKFSLGKSAGEVLEFPRSIWLDKSIQTEGAVVCNTVASIRLRDFLESQLAAVEFDNAYHFVDASTAMDSLESWFIARKAKVESSEDEVGVAVSGGRCGIGHTD